MILHRRLNQQIKTDEKGFIPFFFVLSTFYGILFDFYTFLSIFSNFTNYIKNETFQKIYEEGKWLHGTKVNLTD